MAQAQQQQNEIVIKVYPMVDDREGARLIDNASEPANFYDIEVIEYSHNGYCSNGASQTIFEVENISLDETTYHIAKIEKVHPHATLDWIYC